jgi:amidase
MSGFSEYDQYDGLGLAALVRQGDVTAEELLDEAIVRTEQVNGELNAVVYKFYDQARQTIAKGLPDGLFTGVPFLIKDLHQLIEGCPLSNGSNMYRNDIADHDSTLVARYKDGGLVIFGRTNSPELGLMPVTEPKAYGASRNPWNTKLTPGGSSGGASAAVSAGILPVAHASDGGGSIRIPAAATGLVGLKPSRGRIPFGPDKAEGWGGQSMNHVVSRTVRDTAAMLDVTGGSEVGEPYSAPEQQSIFLAAMSHKPDPVKVGIFRDKIGQGDYDADALEGMQKTIALLEGLGHQVEEVSPPSELAAAANSGFTIISANAALGAQQRADQLGCSVEELDMEDGTRFTVSMGQAVSGTDYIQAIQHNQAAGRAMGRFHMDYDLLLGPTIASAPVEVGYISDAPIDEYADRLFGFMGDTGLFNQTGQPSISLPLHWTADNLPLGMMFTAAYGQDALLLQLAAQLEEAQPWWDRRPPLCAG